MKGGKAGAAPSKRGPLVNSTSVQQKRPRTESVPAKMPDSKAKQQQQQQMQRAQAADAADAEPGLAGLLGRLPSNKLDALCYAHPAEVSQTCISLKSPAIALACCFLQDGWVNCIACSHH